MARPNKREDILEGARVAFYDNGIAATGVDAIAAEAGVSKRTLYNHFETKDDLVHAYIRWRDELWREVLAEHLDGVEEPTERLSAYVEAYLDDTIDPNYRGCALINAAAEVDDESPTLAVIVDMKERSRRDIEDILDAMGNTAPEENSMLILTLLEGACALGGVQRQRADFETLVAAVRVIAGVPAPV